jgi:hypothetical protein
LEGIARFSGREFSARDQRDITIFSHWQQFVKQQTTNSCLIELQSVF